VTPRRTPPEPNCPSCQAGAGKPHRQPCDVARCLSTGLQRQPSCRCPQDTWTGRWPGEAECEEFGWMLGPGMPDLNRLYTNATWDPAACRWTLPDVPSPDR
jgi:hypothetical protein